LGGKFKNRRRQLHQLRLQRHRLIPHHESINSSTSFGAQYYRRRTDDLRTVPSSWRRLETVLATAITTSAEDYVGARPSGCISAAVRLKDKFYLTGAVGSTTTAPGDNFDLIKYPKVSASYIAKETAGLINALKLRAAYGQSGSNRSFAAIRWAVTGDGAAARPNSSAARTSVRERAAESRSATPASQPIGSGSR
jgi:hypothetical protein